MIDAGVEDAGADHGTDRELRMRCSKQERRPSRHSRNFWNFVGSLPILGHNMSFDFGFLKQAAVNLGLTFEKEELGYTEDCKEAAAGSAVPETAGSVCHYRD